ncbi:hypothetical protein IJD15_05980 [bacterium]|nr:hypothetical protein [bacterium]
MADLTKENIKKAKLQGTKQNDVINVADYAEKVSIYASNGSDVISSGSGKTTIYGQSGKNTYYISSENKDTTIVPGVGKAYIELPLGFASSMLEKVKNNLKINITESSVVIIKDYFKNRGEIYVNGQDLRQLTLYYDYFTNKKVSLSTGFTNDNINTNNTITYKDIIKSLDGNDSIYTYGGNDTIYAGAGNDLLNGGIGNDKLYGGSGFNVYEYDNSQFAGNDTIYVENGSISNIRINKNEIDNIYKSKNNLILENSIGEKITLANYFKYNTLVQINGEDIISIINQRTGNSFALTAKGKLIDTVFDDSITGSKSADKIYSYFGSDKINAGKGNDKIYSYSGQANLYFNEGDGKDTIDGVFGEIHINTNNQDTDISQLKLKLSGNDLIISYTQKDSITVKNYKGVHTNSIYINGQCIATDIWDLLNNYQNKLELVQGNNKFYSMENNNIIILPDDFNLNNITNASKSGNNLVLTGVWGSKDKLTIVDYYKNGYDIRFEKNNGEFVGNLNKILETIYKENTYNGGDFSSYSYGLKVTGGIINDYLTMTNYDDIVKAGHGHDYISTKSGNDKVWGGTGNDILYSGQGNDKLYGESGNDMLFGENGNDYIDGGSGNDELFGGEDYDTIKGGSGNDIISGGSGNDSLYGDAGNDDIGGNEGNDTIYGGNGNDSIDGHAGNDLIKGGNGHDFITCEDGRDTIYGDAGNDTIEVFNSYVEVYGGSGNDYIRLNSDSTQNVEIEAGSGNDIIEIDACKNAEVEGGSGNDTIIYYKGNVEAEGGSGNDIYTVHNLASGNKLVIDDSKGKDTINITPIGKSDIRFIFDVEINSKGKIIDSKDIDIKIMHYQVFNNFTQNYSINNLDRLTDGVNIDDYFGSGCIEKINSKDGYYVTKTQLNNVMQEVAAWLYDKGYNSVDQVLSENNGDAQALLQIFNDVNWQQ